MIILLLVLLAYPALAALRLAQTIDPRLVFGYAAFISIITYFSYRHDKRRAQTDGWRTPESTLHLLEFAGGWPGAFLAQRILRHKCSKRSFQLQFWVIVALHEFVSIDFTRNWAWLKAFLHTVLE